MEHVIVGMSGGVDSAVAAHLLLQKGYSVEAVFMKNWVDDSEYCTSEKDYLDALQICDVLKVPLRTVNFSKEYWDKVFKNFLSEYKCGRTPNPDILCNTEIKFKEFLNYAMQLGADKIATGHYAQCRSNNGILKMYKGFDRNKDQSYFLYGLNQEQISKTIFPLGGLNKSQVREYAKNLGFSNYNKKDSTGICFIGERNFKEFLKEYIPAMPGEIITSSGEVVGDHDGLMYYTLGQRKGLGIGGARGKQNAPWYVISKDLDNNKLIVDQGHSHKNLYKSRLEGSCINWISGNKPSRTKLHAKIRYRMKDAPCFITEMTSSRIKVKFNDPQFAIAPGQSIVFYDDDQCIGGAIIEKAYN